MENITNMEFEFSFEATSDPRKGVPYVAKLVYRNGKLEREFYNLNRTWGKNMVTVSGKYKAKSGDIIERRSGASWKNDYRYWFLVTPDGKQVKVADIDDSEAKVQVIEYLKGNLKAEDLVEE